MTPERDKQLLFVAGMITGIIVCAAITGFVLSDQVPAQYKTPLTQPFTQPLSDEEYLRIGVDSYFMSNFDNPNFPKPDYDVALEDQAVDNAIRGERLWLSVSGNTAEEALTTLIALDADTNCDQASFWLATNKRDYPGTKYAIGIYKTSYDQYNISIVIEKPHPDTQELNRNGAWITIKHNPVIRNFETYCHRLYFWEETDFEWTDLDSNWSYT